MPILQRLRPQGTTSSERVLRSMIFVLLLFGIGYLFWHNYDRSMQRVTARHAVVDRTGQLAPELSKEVVEFSRRMRERFGIAVEVRIARQELLAPEGDAKTLYIGIVPSRQLAVVMLPPLMERALEPTFVAYLMNDHFGRYWAEENGWQSGLQEAMVLVWDRMRKLEQADG